MQPSMPTASLNLQLFFLKKAITECYTFFDQFFDASVKGDCVFSDANALDELANQLMSSLKRAEELSLFQKGGIPRRDFVSLWCVFRYLKPDYYTESGVFIGSSFFACTEASPHTKALGIDPNLANLRIPATNNPNSRFTSKYDFCHSESMKRSGGISIAYFDDHINSALRIIQSWDKGYNYLIFDDSLGLDGTIAKKYPAFPSIPFILHSDELKEGDFVKWSYSSTSSSLTNVKRVLRNVFNVVRLKAHEEISATFSNELISLCMEASSKIERCSKLPQLGDFILPNNYSQFVDTSKYIIKLKS